MWWWREFSVVLGWYRHNGGIAMSQRDELAGILEAMASTMERNPTVTGNRIIGIANGSGTGISASVVNHGYNTGKIVGMEASVSVGSREESETIARLRDAAAALRNGRGDKSLIDSVLEAAHRFGARVIDYGVMKGATALAVAIFG